MSNYKLPNPQYLWDPFGLNLFFKKLLNTYCKHNTKCHNNFSLRDGSP